MKRAFIFLSTLALLRCSTYGTEPDETPAATRDAGAESATTDATTAANGDATTDVAETATACVSNDQACSALTPCCTGKCAEDRLCRTECKAQGTSCDATNLTSCCLGLWCNGLGCTPCVPSGSPAAAPGSIPVAHSCCSRALKDGGNCE